MAASCSAMPELQTLPGRRLATRWRSVADSTLLQLARKTRHRGYGLMEALLGDESEAPAVWSTTAYLVQPYSHLTLR